MKTKYMTIKIVWVFAAVLVSISLPTMAQTPYPGTFEVPEIPSSLYEKTRLRQVEFFQDKFDHQLTGFYVASGKKVEVNVEILNAPADGAIPKIVIGTPERAGNIRTEIGLTPGTNTIMGTAHSGGMIYFRFVSNTASIQGKIRVTFAPASEQVRAPYYIKGITTAQEFDSMLDNYTTPDVMFSSKDAVVVVSREAALRYSKATDKDAWLASIERILLAEDKISGLSNEDPNPLHHRLATGIRHLFSETNSGYMYAGNMATAYYTSAALERLLTNNQIDNNSWGISHELGHTRQQTAYKADNFTEVTVNIYSAAVQREFHGANWIKSTAATWNNLQTLYFTLSDATRNFHNESIAPVAGVSIDSRFMMFDQLQIILGDEFYHRLHRITREEKVAPGNDEDRRGYFVLKACQLSGYDLRDYFNKWGFVLSAYHQSIVAKAIEKANLKKPTCNETLHLTTPYSKPSCLPLPLIGIATSSPEVVVNAGYDAVEKYCVYSSKTGVFTDPRDKKQYAYKKYGGYEWFMRNLDWDGYDGITESSRGTVGIYGSDDPDGKIFGRMYATNSTPAQYDRWCPEGWTVPTESIWSEMIESIKSEYKLNDSGLVACLKCGGDKDDQADGLWAKGVGSINPAKSAEIGFNALPAGVYNKEAAAYDSGDQPGTKASFFIPSSVWFHQVLSGSSDLITYPNRNSRHLGSIRCVRKAVITNISDSQSTDQCRVYFNVDSSKLLIVNSVPVNFILITDIMGRTLFTKACTNELSPLVINSQPWQKGIYVYKIISANGRVESGKVIKN